MKIGKKKLIVLSILIAVVLVVSASVRFIIFNNKTVPTIQEIGNTIMNEVTFDTQNTVTQNVVQLNNEISVEAQNIKTENKVTETNKNTTTQNKTNSTKKITNTTKKETTSYYIKVNYGAQVVTIYKKDNSGNYTIPVKAMVCSTGVATPTSGVYKIPGRWKWGGLQGGVYGQYVTVITGNILFHSVPYLQRGNPGSLEYWEYDKLGTAASAGCVRLTVADAKWIYDNCKNGTQVEFYSSSSPGPLGKPIAKKISNAEGDLKNWDPTDPNSSNPWKNVSANSTNTTSKNEVTTNNTVNTGTNTETKSENTISNNTIENSTTNNVGNNITNSTTGNKQDNVVDSITNNENRVENLKAGNKNNTVTDNNENNVDLILKDTSKENAESVQNNNTKSDTTTNNTINT